LPSCESSSDDELLISAPLATSPLSSALTVGQPALVKATACEDSDDEGNTVEIDEDEESTAPGVGEFCPLEEEEGMCVPAGLQAGHNKRCRVPECSTSDLSHASNYYLKHGICKQHVTMPAIDIDGVSQRFCQKCTRFHEIPEFDGAKHTCRKGLELQQQRRLLKIGKIGPEVDVDSLWVKKKKTLDPTSLKRATAPSRSLSRSSTDDGSVHSVETVRHVL
jgi:hypothetical protein